MWITSTSITWVAPCLLIQVLALPWLGQHRASYKKADSTILRRAACKAYSKCNLPSYGSTLLHLAGKLLTFPSFFKLSRLLTYVAFWTYQWQIACWTYFVAYLQHVKVAWKQSFSRIVRGSVIQCKIYDLHYFYTHTFGKALTRTSTALMDQTFFFSSHCSSKFPRKFPFSTLQFSHVSHTGDVLMKVMEVFAL